MDYILHITVPPPTPMSGRTISTLKLLNLVKQLEDENVSDVEQLKRLLEQSLRNFPEQEKTSDDKVSRKLSRQTRSTSLPDLNISYAELLQGLMESAQSGDAEELEFLITLPTITAVINDMDQSGMSPLHWVSKHGHPACLKVLMQVKHLDVNSRDDQGWTPLHYAAYNGHIEVVTLLLQHRRINVVARNKQKQTPCECAKTKEIATLLQYAEKKK